MQPPSENPFLGPRPAPYILKKNQKKSAAEAAPSRCCSAPAHVLLPCSRVATPHPHAEPRGQGGANRVGRRGAGRGGADLRERGEAQG